MEQLTLGDILAMVQELKKQGMTLAEIKKLPVYIGDDEELNGIHSAWYCQSIDENDKENCEGFIELIDEQSGNAEFTGKAILIS